MKERTLGCCSCKLRTWAWYIACTDIGLFWGFWFSSAKRVYHIVNSTDSHGALQPVPMGEVMMLMYCTFGLIATGFLCYGSHYRKPHALRVWIIYTIFSTIAGSVIAVLIIIGWSFWSAGIITLSIFLLVIWCSFHGFGIWIVNIFKQEIEAADLEAYLSTQPSNSQL